MHNDKGNKHRS